MNFNKVNLVYFSATSVSKKYAVAMAEALKKETVEYDFTLPANRMVENAPSFTSEDLVIVSVPIYGGRVPTVCLDYLNALKGDNTPCVVVGTYGNRHYDDAVVELEDIMKANGFTVIAGAATIGRHSFTSDLAGDRPNTEDLDNAKEFILKAVEKDLAPLAEGVIPGARPYKEKGPANGLHPSTTDDCINCKICAKGCPSQIISYDNCKEFSGDTMTCLKCCKCVVSCPKQAKEFTQEAFINIQNYLVSNFGATARPNEYFL